MGEADLTYFDIEGLQHDIALDLLAEPLSVNLPPSCVLRWLLEWKGSDRNEFITGASCSGWYG